jgi:uncharacterized delta-60 repeat protein
MHIRRVGGALLYALMFVASVFAGEPPGSLDTSFRTGTGMDATVNCIALQPDNKVLFGGIFNLYNGVTRHKIVRVHPFGSLDTSFDSPITDSTAEVNSIAVQTNGQIIVGMDGTSALLRLNSSGQIDPTFNIGTGPNRGVEVVALQPDGKILIGGSFTEFNGVRRMRLARLNSDGTLDSSFDPLDGAEFTVFCLAVQEDGEILVGGQFSRFAGQMYRNLVRLYSDGGVDTSFVPGAGPDQTVYTIQLQPNGKPVIGGFFENYDGHSQYAVARLNTDGSYDASFASLAELKEGTVFALELQRDGKIVVAGDMTSAHLVRLNTDGSKDLTYQPGLGPGDDVYAMAIQPDQKILIGGLFVAVDTNQVFFAARINSDLKLLTPSKNGAVFGSEIQTVSGKIYNLEYKNSLNDLNWSTVSNSKVTGDGTVKLLQDTNAIVGQRFYRVSAIAD